MVGHTPGPFSIEYKKRFSTEGNMWVVLNSDRYPLAFVPAWDSPGKGEEDGTEEAKANANLVWSAPDLLEAAVNLIERWHSPNWKNTENTAMYIKALEAAVERAKGN